MCSLGMASLGTQAAGVGMSTVGSFFAAKSQQAQYRSAARIAEINATVSDSNARNITRAGTMEESRVKLRGAQAKSQTMARLGASGVDIAASNSALAQLAGNDLVTNADAQTMRLNAIRAAWGQRFEAGNQRRAANSARASAEGISPGLAAFSSLISGASQVASSWYSMDKAGAGDSNKPTDLPTGSVIIGEGTGGGGPKAGSMWDMSNSLGLPIRSVFPGG